MYFAPIFKLRIMSPLNRGSGLFLPFPRGFRLRQAYAVTSRRFAAPPPGYHISPLAGALISAGIRPQSPPPPTQKVNFHLPSSARHLSSEFWSWANASRVLIFILYPK